MQKTANYQSPFLFETARKYIHTLQLANHMFPSQTHMCAYFNFIHKTNEAQTTVPELHSL